MIQSIRDYDGAERATRDYSSKFRETDSNIAHLS